MGRKEYIIFLKGDFIMKKFLTIAAAVATSAVLITSVFAETAPMTATYDAESGNVILTDAPTGLATTTYIVFDRENQDGVASGTVAEGLIKQIDQKENTTVTEIYVGPLDDGKYQVRLGGDGSVRDALFEVVSATPTPTPTVEPTATPTAAPSTEPTTEPTTEPSSEPEATPTPIPYVIGNANMKRGVDVNDAITILEYKAGLIQLDTVALLAANANQKRGVDVNDAIEILDWLASNKTKESPIGTRKEYTPTVN